MKRDVLWNSLGTAAWSFLSLALLVIVTRVNGIADSGLFSFAFAVALIMYTVACYGVRTYQVSDHEGQFSTDGYVALRLATAAGAVLLTIFFVLVNRYDWEKSALILILVGQRIFDAVSDVFFGILQRNRLLYMAGRSLFFKSVLSFGVFLAVNLVTGDLLMASFTLPAISFLFLVLHDIPKSRNVEQFRISVWVAGQSRILKSIFLPFVIAVMGLVFANVARYFVDLYAPDLQGYFGIVIMPLSLIILLFSFVSTPAILHISGLYNTSQIRNLHRLIGKITGLTLAATLVLTALTYFFGVPVLNMLFNLDFEPYLWDIIVIVLIGLALSLSSLFTQVAIISREIRFTASVYILSTLLLAVLCVLLIARYEIRGAIVAYAVAAVFQVATMGVYYLRLTKNQSDSKNS